MQTSTQPNATTNYTITVEKNFQQTDLLPYVRLTLPECIRLVTGRRLEIIDHQAIGTPNQQVLYTQYSPIDYVFQLRYGVNFLTLLNLVNPVENCLWQSSRLSFEYRTFADSSLKFSMDQRLQGLEPSLSCKYPCQTCQVVDKSFCTSC
jgi:hypothetical protein